MKIYFEDGQLDVSNLPPHIDKIISAADGPSFCESTLRLLDCIEPRAKVYTNYLGAMSSKYSWDKENNKCECYIRNSHGEWTNIQDMTNRELRFAHNIPKMYIAGEFKKD